MKNDIEIIRNASGANRCPNGKVCLYTHAHYNTSESGDILVLGPDLQLDKQTLESFGFMVGGRDGVTAVVNNMTQDTTLVSGFHLDGETLRVQPGTQIPDLTDYPLGKWTWNDATQSVVSAPTESVNLKVKLDANISLPNNETRLIELSIHNESTVFADALTVEVIAADSEIVLVGGFNQNVSVPAQGNVSVQVPLTGKNRGSTTLTVRLHTPIGLINRGENVKTRNVKITETEISLTLSMPPHLALKVGEHRLVPLAITNKSNIAVNGVVVTPTSENEACLSVDAFDNSVDLPPADTRVIQVPVTGLAAGTTKLQAAVSVPPEFVNLGEAVTHSDVEISNISVTLSLSMTSEFDLKTGESYYVSLTIQNQSNIAVKDIVITPRSGDDALLAVDTFNNVVDLSAEETRVIRIPVKTLAAGTTTLQTAISVPPGFVNTGDRQVHAKAVIVTQRDLNVTQILKGHWKKVWDQPEWIYSYGLTLSSASARVVKWRLSFLLLDGAKLDPDWLETQKHWLEVDEEASTEGYIALTNKSGHTVEPGATLPLDIQVLYPEESNQYNQLHNIRLRQLQ